MTFENFEELKEDIMAKLRYYRVNGDVELAAIIVFEELEKYFLNKEE